MQETNLSRPADSMIGKLLVASTTIQDPVLSRSVSLVVHQDTENVYAVLLNRPMTPPPELMQMLKAAVPASEQRSRQGHLRMRQPQDDAGTQTPAQHLIAAKAAAEAAHSLGMIHFGGPLSGPVVAVHNSSAHAEAQAGRGVYVAAQRDVLETLVKLKPASFRLIVGHLGWSIAQLNAERDAGFWHVLDATDEDVFTGDQDIWPKVIRRATSGSLVTWLGMKVPSANAETN